MVPILELQSKNGLELEKEKFTKTESIWMSISKDALIKKSNREEAIVYITKARLVDKKRIFEAEVLVQDKYTVYAGMLLSSREDGDSFDDSENYEYFRIFNTAFEGITATAEDVGFVEGWSFRSDLPEDERREIYNLCMEIFEKVMKANPEDGKWQIIREVEKKNIKW